MAITFYKYQGTGNDFVLIDNRRNEFSKNNTKRIALMCDRRFGIGADGLILLEQSEKADFKMVYYNADGNESSMCGNGGRCITHFARFLGISGKTTSFEAIDGIHQAEITNGKVALRMNDVSSILANTDYLFLDTGSPHHVEITAAVDELDVIEKGREIRHSRYGQAGANVNFVEQLDTVTFKVRTYERGVEDETLSCGTGVTAVAIAMHASGRTTADQLVLKTPGGDLEVRFKLTESGYTDIYLVGPAELVFKGVWE